VAYSASGSCRPPRSHSRLGWGLDGSLGGDFGRSFSFERSPQVCFRENHEELGAQVVQEGHEVGFELVAAAAHMPLRLAGDEDPEEVRAVSVQGIFLGFRDAAVLEALPDEAKARDPHDVPGLWQNRCHVQQWAIVVVVEGESLPGINHILFATLPNPWLLPPVLPHPVADVARSIFTARDVLPEKLDQPLHTRQDTHVIHLSGGVSPSCIGATGVISGETR
jgi:hypothetical protein